MVEAAGAVVVEAAGAVVDTGGTDTPTWTTVEVETDLVAVVLVAALVVDAPGSVSELIGSSPSGRATAIQSLVLRALSETRSLRVLTISTGVPRGRSLANLVMLTLSMRTHPWLTSVPILPGAFVP